MANPWAQHTGAIAFSPQKIRWEGQAWHLLAEISLLLT